MFTNTADLVYHVGGRAGIFLRRPADPADGEVMDASGSSLPSRPTRQPPDSSKIGRPIPRGDADGLANPHGDAILVRLQDHLFVVRLIESHDLDGQLPVDDRLAQGRQLDGHGEGSPLPGKSKA